MNGLSVIGCVFYFVIGTFTLHLVVYVCINISFSRFVYNTIIFWILYVIGIVEIKVDVFHAMKTFAAQSIIELC